MPKGWDDKVLKWLDHFEPILDEWDRLITHNSIFVKRLANVAIITAEEAVDWGIVGPNLRASGGNWDVRKEDKDSAYGKIDFNVPIGQGHYGTVGDCWERFLGRVEEGRESVKIP